MGCISPLEDHWICFSNIIKLRGLSLPFLIVFEIDYKTSLLEISWVEPKTKLQEIREYFPPRSFKQELIKYASSYV